MTSDHDYRDAPGSVPTRLGRGGMALREAVHRLIAPYFEQARLRTEEVRQETAGLREEIAGLREEMAALGGDVAALQGQTAELRATLDELGAAQAALRSETEDVLAVAPSRFAAGDQRAERLEERIRGAELELRAVTRRLAEALDSASS